MPLPPHAFTIPGGCNCRAICYRIAVPRVAERPSHPTSRPSATQPQVHLPMIFTDHCNDCRRASGSLVPAWITVPYDWVTIDLVPHSGSASDLTLGSQYSAGPIGEQTSDSVQTRPASEVLLGPSNANKGTFLQFYESSPGCLRGFCGRCGTQLSFAAPAYMPDIVDVVLGTIDRDVLEQDWMMPDRQYWWDLGIGWVKALVGSGEWAVLAKHPKMDNNEYLG